MKKRWGYYKILLQGKGFWFKKIHFDDKPMSFQTHDKRDELWLIYVPAGTKHTIKAKGDVYELAIGNPKERDKKRHPLPKGVWEDEKIKV